MDPYSLSVDSISPFLCKDVLRDLLLDFQALVSACNCTLISVIIWLTCVPLLDYHLQEGKNIVTFFVSFMQCLAQSRCSVYTYQIIRWMTQGQLKYDWFVMTCFLLRLFPGTTYLYRSSQIHCLIFLLFCSLFWSKYNIKALLFVFSIFCNSHITVDFISTPLFYRLEPLVFSFWLHCPPLIFHHYFCLYYFSLTFESRLGLERDFEPLIFELFEYFAVSVC